MSTHNYDKVIMEINFFFFFAFLGLDELRQDNRWLKVMRQLFGKVGDQLLITLYGVGWLVGWMLDDKGKYINSG